jgi:acetylornithine deacetylase/succinyl-diaminopimelate desuccinylase-like protein
LPEERLLEELKEYLRIPSISTGETDPLALGAAADWVATYIRKAGGAAEIIETSRNPLVYGELASRDLHAPVALIYGHYDVQSPGNLDEWTSPPFEPEVRDGRIYARGSSDNKGNLFPLLFVAREMAEKGELPINLRFLVEGEEEVGSFSAMSWFTEDDGPADCAIVFDSGSLSADLPAITVGTRGVIALKINVRTSERDLHSGIYGGVVHNPNHVLVRMVREVMPGPDGILREELRAGIAPPSKAETRSWESLPSAELFLRESGAGALSPEAAADYYRRNWAEPSVDVNMLSGGEPRTVVPATASAYVTMRVAPGQNSGELQDTLQKLIRAEAPESAEVDIEAIAVDAAAFDPESQTLQISRAAVKKATGNDPLLIRLGGSIPILAPLAARGIPTLVGGFIVPDDAFHAPNESYRLEALDYGVATARELYRDLVALKR